jgi:FAD/FMN-containing dehydrogenase
VLEVGLHDRHAELPVLDKGPLLAHGLGRSYGDVALNAGAVLLRTRGLDRFISFDPGTGILRAEAGVSLAEVLALVMPQGWFLSVTPGTRFVTLGGAVANDVHGKNHHRAGTFGHHVTALELLRSDGTRLECRPEGTNADWFRATVGGLGLTGLIVWVEIQLARIAQPFMWTVNRRFNHLDDYWALDAELGARHSHGVAWVDCLRGGRGIYSAADFAGHGLTPPRAGRSSARSMPIDPPFSLINGLTLRAFNLAYFRKPLPADSVRPALPFFYPLDSVLHWNRIYGRRGFFQYQCLLPPAAMRQASTALFDRIARHGLGSFLAVFKTFGNQAPAGLLSFARPGATLALDFPNHGDRTLRLFDELDAIVRDAGGALYPAKDARMSPRMFQQSFPRLHEFSDFVDPAFSSSFWRRASA